jgi:hypothetical protein
MMVLGEANDGGGTRREVDTCYDCIVGLCEAGWMDHPPRLWWGGVRECAGQKAACQVCPGEHP